MDQRNKTLRLVIIGDQKLSRLGIPSLLHDNPNICIEAEAKTNEEGIEAVKAHSPEVVLVDIDLSTLDGIEVTRRIKRFNSDIRIIIVTSRDIDQAVLATLSAGADAYCLKSSLAQRLTEIMGSIQAGGAWLDPMIARKVVCLFSEQGPAATALQHIPVSDDGHASRTKLGLTEREGKILALIVQGKNNAEIAKTLFISYHTVKSDVTNILQKLSVHDRVQAAVKALRDHLV